MSLLTRIQSLLHLEAKSTDPNYNTNVQFINVGQPRYSEHNYRSYVREAYAKNVVVYKCINEVARVCASIKWKAFTDDSLKKELTDHPLLNLWKQPNPRKANTMFIRDMFVQWQISGNAFILAARTGKNAPPDALWLLRSDRIKIIPGQYDVQEYLYGANVGTATHYDPGDILHLEYYNPEDDWYGLSPVQVVAGLVDQQNEGVGWNLALMQNGGRPSGAFVYPGQINDAKMTTVERMIDRRVSGQRNAGRPLVMDSGVTYVEMGKTPTDMDWSNQREMNTRDIASALDVAPELAGDAAGKTFANVQEARQSLYTEKALPMLDEVQDQLNLWLPPMFAKFGPCYLAYDRNDIEALQENRQVASTRAYTGWNAGTLTFNEAREMLGMEKLPGGDVIKWNAAIVPINQIQAYAEQAMAARMAGLQNAALGAPSANPAQNNTPAQQNQQNQGQGNAAPPQQQQGNTNSNNANNNQNSSDSDDDTNSGKSLDRSALFVIGGKATRHEIKALDLSTREAKTAYLQQMEAARERWYSDVESKIAAYFAQEQKAITQSLTTPETAYYRAQKAVESGESTLKDLLVKAYQEIGHDIGNEVGKAFPSPKDSKSYAHKAITVNMLNAQTVQYLLQLAGIKVKQIDATTLDMLRKALAEGVSLGEGIPQLAKRIDALYLDQIIPNRSATIARTEVVGASNNSAMLAARQAAQDTGMTLNKVWLATDDDRTREDHADADGQEVPIDQPFSVGGFDMDAPGDSSAPAGEVINCRCTVYFNRVQQDTSDADSQDDQSDMESASRYKRPYQRTPYRAFQEAYS